MGGGPGASHIFWGGRRGALHIFPGLHNMLVQNLFGYFFSGSPSVPQGHPRSPQPPGGPGNPKRTQFRPNFESASPSVSGLRRLDLGGVALLRRDKSEMRVYNRSYWLQLVSLVRVKKISWRNANL